VIQKLQFAREFESLKRQGRLNRLENIHLDNIAVNNLQLFTAGVQNHEIS
jgi:hypothetical protein